MRVGQHLAMIQVLPVHTHVFFNFLLDGEFSGSEKFLCPSSEAKSYLYPPAQKNTLFYLVVKKQAVGS